MVKLYTSEITEVDLKLLQALRRGEDSPVFEVLYQRTYEKVRRNILKSGGTDPDAEDIFQDAVLTFYRMVKRGKYEHQTGIDGFIYAVARNLWLNRLRVKKRTSAMHEDFDAPSPDPSIEANLFSQERQRRVHLAISKLGDRCRQLLELTVFQGKSMKEICQAMGFKNENAAKTRHYKCKQRLAEIVQKDEALVELYKP